MVGRVHLNAAFANPNHGDVNENDGVGNENDELVYSIDEVPKWKIALANHGDGVMNENVEVKNEAIAFYIPAGGVINENDGI